MVQQRLLDIAVQAFGQRGLDGASTRAIAREAGTAMSSITYHYGGKEGLYLAAADHISARMSQIFDASTLEGIVTPGAARAAIHTMLLHYVQHFREDRGDGWALFLMREQMAPTEAFERIYAGPMGENMRALVRLVAIATGADDPVAARLAAMSLFGQVLVIKAGRATCRRVLEQPALSRDILSRYADRVAANIDAILDRMIAERQEPA